MRPFKQRMKPFVERALDSPKDSCYRYATLRQGYLLFLKFAEFLKTPVELFNSPTGWVWDKVEKKEAYTIDTIQERQTLENYSADYIKDLCDFKAVSLDFSDLLHTRLSVLIADVYKAIKLVKYSKKKVSSILRYD